MGAFMKKKSSDLLGEWRMEEMEMWDRDFMDMEVPAYIRFEKDGTSEFQFGLVKGWIDHRAVVRGGKPALEFSWEGSDEMDPATGRGWAVLNDNGNLEGRLVFHLGDESGFIATRKRVRSKGKSR